MKTNKTKFQIVSDLHVDFSDNYIYSAQNLKPSNFSDEETKILIVAGDTCQNNYKKRDKFIHAIFSKWDTVIEVPGNHDHYEKSYDWSIANHALIHNVTDDVLEIDKLENMSLAIEKNHVIEDDGYSHHLYINNDYIDVSGIRIICSTLWSEILDNGHLIMRGMNDYNLIDKYDIPKNNERYYNSVKFIEKTLKNTPEDMKCIVVTHHLPMWELISGKYITNNMNEAYASKGLIKLIKKYSSKIKYWIHGHSHDQLRVKYFETEFIRNPLGYSFLGEGGSFDKNLVLEL